MSKKALIKTTVIAAASIAAAVSANAQADEVVTPTLPTTPAENVSEVKEEVATPITHTQVQDAVKKADQTDANEKVADQAYNQKLNEVQGQEGKVKDLQEDVVALEGKVKDLSPDAIADQHDAISNAANDVAVIATELRALGTLEDDAKQDVEDGKRKVTEAEGKVRDAENDVKKKTDDVKTAENNLKGLNIPDLKTKMDDATTRVTNAETRVKNAEDRLKDARKQDGNQIQALDDARNDLKTIDAKITDATAKITDATATDKKLKADLADRRAKVGEALRKQYNLNIELPDEFIDEFLDTTDEEGYLKDDKRRPEEIERIIKKYKLDEQRYKFPDGKDGDFWRSEEFDNSKLVGGGDVNNATEDEKREINEYALKIMQEFGVKTVKRLPNESRIANIQTTQSMWDMAWEVAEESTRKNQEFGSGHDKEAIYNAARKQGLRDTVQQYESLYTLGSTNPKYTMEELKAVVYNAIIRFMYHDAKSEYGHTDHIAAMGAGSVTNESKHLDKTLAVDVAVSFNVTKDGGLFIHVLSNPDRVAYLDENGNVVDEWAYYRYPGRYNANVIYRVPLNETDELTALQNEIKDLESKIAENETLLNNLNTQLSEAKVDKTATEKKIATLEAGELLTPAAEKELEDAKAELKAAESALKTATDNYTAATASKAEKEAKLKEAQNALTVAEGNLTNARANLTNTVNNLKALEAKEAEATRKHEAKKAELKKAEQALKDAQAKLAEMENLPKLLDDAKTKLKEAETTVKTLKDELQALEQKLFRAKKDNKDAQNIKNDLISRYADYVKKVTDDRKLKEGLSNGQDGGFKVTPTVKKPEVGDRKAGTVVYVALPDGRIQAFEYKFNPVTGDIDEEVYADGPERLTSDSNGKVYVKGEGGVYYIPRVMTPGTPSRPLTPATPSDQVKTPTQYRTPASLTQQEGRLATLAGKTSANQAHLPKTGETSSVLSVLGVIVATVGLAGMKRKGE